MISFSSIVALIFRRLVYNISDSNLCFLGKSVNHQVAIVKFRLIMLCGVKRNGMLYCNESLVKKTNSQINYQSCFIQSHSIK